MDGAKVYTTLFPCNECTKALIQSGIREVIYGEDKYANTASVIAAKKMMASFPRVFVVGTALWHAVVANR